MNEEIGLVAGIVSMISGARFRCHDAIAAQEIAYRVLEGVVPVDAGVTLLLPAGHDVHMVAPHATENLPAGQSLHALFPTPVENLPGLQLLQEVCPIALWY